MTSSQKVEFVLTAIIAVLFIFLTFYQFFKYRFEKRKLMKKIKLLEKAANFDCLTGVYSRAAFVNVVTECLAENSYGTLLLFDIDGFKRVNDSLGHIEGDGLIKRFADKLKKSFGDVPIGRLGGDEFMVFIKGEIDRENINEKIKKADAGKFYDKITKFKLTVCCGAAQSPKHGESFEQLYCMADKALYKAKKGEAKMMYAEE